MEKSVKALIYILFLLSEYAANSLFSGEWFIPLDLVCFSVTRAAHLKLWLPTNEAFSDYF